MSRFRSRWLVPVVLVGIVVVVVVISWFYFFGKVSSAAKLVPADNMIYIQLDPQAGDIIPSEDGGYLETLGSVFWSSFSFSNPWFSYEDDVKPWLGDEVVLTKASSDQLDPFVLLAEVGDKQKALETVEKMEEKMAGGEGEVNTVRYKGVDVYQVEDPVMISGCYYKGYVIMSTKIENVKNIIDVGNGDAPAIDGVKQFKKLSDNLSDGENRSLLVALRLREALEATTSTLGVSSQLFVKRLDFPEEMMLGLGIWPETEGLEIKTYLGTARLESLKNIEESHLSGTMPQDAIIYYEGEDFASVVSEFFGNVDVNEKALSWASGSYAASLIPQSGDKKSAIALAIEVEDEELAKAKIREAEPVLIGSLASLGITGDLEFKDGEASGVATRYVSFSEGVAMDLNYAVSGDKLLFATSKSALETLLDVDASNIASLADNDDFAETLSKTKASRQIGFLFLQTSGLTDLLSPTVVGDIATEEEIPQGFIAQALAPFSSLGISLHNTGKGDFLTDMYLKFKSSE